MLISNSKELCNKVREYLMNSVNCDYLEIPEEASSAMKVKWVYINFIQEFYAPNSYNRKLFNNKYSASVQWLKGLPGCLYLEFTYHEQRMRLREWFEQSHEESIKYHDGIVADNFYYLISREFFRMLDSGVKNGTIEGYRQLEAIANL